MHIQRYSVKLILAKVNKLLSNLIGCRRYGISASYVEYSIHTICNFTLADARRAGSDGSMSAYGLEGPGFDLRRGSKFSFENFEPRG